MSGERRLRSLILSVAVVVAVLLFASRWAGRAGAPVPYGAAGDPAGEPEAAHPVSSAGALLDAPTDLSFYRTLGATRPPEELRHTVPPRPSSSAADIFVVQVLATRDEALARRLRDGLVAGGFPAALSETRARGAGLFRVRVGRYRERAAAEGVARRLRAERHLDPWVLRESD
jgi:cell division septation protein DedD